MRFNTTTFTGLFSFLQLKNTLNYSNYPTPNSSLFSPLPVHIVFPNSIDHVLRSFDVRDIPNKDETPPPKSPIHEYPPSEFYPNDLALTIYEEVFGHLRFPSVLLERLLRSVANRNICESDKMSVLQVRFVVLPRLN
jgi:hypothetical protein